MRLTRRERWLAVSMAVLIAAWLLFTVAIRPAIERMETLNRVIPEKQRTLQELRTKSARYLVLRAGLDNLQRQADAGEKEFELLAFLESITNDLHLAEKVTMMKQQVVQLDSDYSETIVEVKLENITLKQLVEFLLTTKSSNQFLCVRSLYTRKNVANPNLLDAVTQISTLRLNEAI